MLFNEYGHHEVLQSSVVPSINQGQLNGAIEVTMSERNSARIPPLLYRNCAPWKINLAMLT